jgi:maltose alpha-D-glucosyltransferase/alpha-amylase
MIEVRRQHSAFAVGTLSDLGGSNPSVLSYVLEFAGDEQTGEAPNTVLCVNNLSRFPQPVELDLRRFIGWNLVELTGGSPFPTVGELSYLLTLPGHGFYWFELTPDPEVYTTG